MNISRLFEQNLVLPSYQNNPHRFLKKQRKKAMISHQNRFFGHWNNLWPYTDFSLASCNVCPCGDLRNLWANTRIRLLTTHSLGTKFIERGCYGFFSLWKLSAYYSNYFYMISQLDRSICLLLVSSYPSQSIILIWYNKENSAMKRQLLAELCPLVAVSVTCRVAVH